MKKAALGGLHNNVIMAFRTASLVGRELAGDLGDTVDVEGKTVVSQSTVLNPQGSINPVLMGADASMGVGYDATGPYITVTVVAGDIPQPDGSTISVPGSGPTTYRNWAGAAVLANTTYRLNVVWDVGAAAVALQEGNGTPTLASKAQAFTDGKIPIRYGLYNTTPAVQGGGGGSSGGGNPCFSGNTTIRTPEGRRRFDNLPHSEPFEVLRGGVAVRAVLLVHEGFSGPMLDMGDGELVTPPHLMRRPGHEWKPAGAIFNNQQHHEFFGTVYNLHIFEAGPEEDHYDLGNGWQAHNSKEI